MADIQNVHTLHENLVSYIIKRATHELSLTTNEQEKIKDLDILNQVTHRVMFPIYMKPLEDEDVKLLSYYQHIISQVFQPLIRDLNQQDKRKFMARLQYYIKLFENMLVFNALIMKTIYMIFGINAMFPADQQTVTIKDETEVNLNIMDLISIMKGQHLVNLFDTFHEYLTECVKEKNKFHPIKSHKDLLSLLDKRPLIKNILDHTPSIINDRKGFVSSFGTYIEPYTISIRELPVPLLVSGLSDFTAYNQFLHPSAALDRFKTNFDTGPMKQEYMIWNSLSIQLQSSDDSNDSMKQLQIDLYNEILDRPKVPHGGKSVSDKWSDLNNIYTMGVLMLDDNTYQEIQRVSTSQWEKWFGVWKYYTDEKLQKEKDTWNFLQAVLQRQSKPNGNGDTPRSQWMAYFTGQKQWFDSQLDPTIKKNYEKVYTRLFNKEGDKNRMLWMTWYSYVKNIDTIPADQQYDSSSIKQDIGRIRSDLSQKKVDEIKKTAKQCYEEDTRPWKKEFQEFCLIPWQFWMKFNNVVAEKIMMWGTYKQMNRLETFFQNTQDTKYQYPNDIRKDLFVEYIINRVDSLCLQGFYVNNTSIEISYHNIFPILQ